MATRMQQRRGTAATWTAADPILAAGEIGFEIDTNKFKIGDGSNRWAQLTYFTADAAAAIEDLIDGAPGLLNTLNELAAAVNDDPNFFATVATNLSNHEADTTNVHGIANTAELATKTFAAELLTNATKTNITITGDKNGLVITAENGVADSTTSDLAEGTNLYFTDERAQDAVGNSVGTGLSYDDSSGAISVTPNTYDAYGSVSSHNSNTTNVHGIADTANLVVTNTSQTLTNKTINLSNNTISGTVAQFNTALSDGNFATLEGTETLSNKTLSSPTITVGATTVSDTEISYLDGVTSSIQTQLDAKANLTGASFTGTLTNTASISTTDTTASTSPTTGSIVAAGGIGIGGDAHIDGDLVIGGNFTVNGTTTTVSTQDLIVQDPLIYVGESNPSNIVDLGIVASFDDGTYQHTGFVRDASAGTWKLFKGVTDEPTSTVNFAQGSLDDLAVGGLSATSLTVGDVSNTEIGYLNGVTSAIQTQIDGKISASSSDTLTNKTINMTNNALSGTIEQFNASLSDADFATLNGTETLQNKTISYTNNTITVQVSNVSDLTANASELNVLDGITASTAELNILDGVTSSTSEINILDGATVSAAELNILDGATVSTSEINYLGGVTSSVQTQLDSKSPSASPTFTGTVVLPSTTSIGDVSSDEISVLNGLTASTAELNTLDGLTASTAELNILDGLTASTADLNILNGVTASTSEINILDGVTASTTEINYVAGVTSAIQTQMNAKAPLASPSLTGTPTAPTASLGTNTTQIATTAFVDAAIEALASRNLILDGGGV